MTTLTFVANTTTAQATRRAHEGREYLVVPVIAIREGVLNGEFVPAEEIGVYVEAWNGIPAPLGHPQVDGTYVSANTPDLVAQAPGRFWNASFRDNALHGEIWLDVARCEELGGDALVALQRFDAGERVELSTAYWRDEEPGQGSYGGKPYGSTGRNLRPDHLAILLHERGACSWEDGCGGPRVNAAHEPRHTSVIIALYPSEEDARALALDEATEGATPLMWEDLHLTLAYCGKVDEQRANQGDALSALAEFARYAPVVRGAISGSARFYREDEEGDAYVALFNAAYLEEWRASLLGILSYDFLVSHAHPFTPHVTLAYLPADASLPAGTPPRRALSFSQLGLAWGDQVTLFALQGEVRHADHRVNVGSSPLHGVLPRLRQLMGGLLGHDAQPTKDEDMADEKPDEKKPDVQENKGTCTCGKHGTPAANAQTVDVNALVQQALNEALGGLDVNEVKALAANAKAAAAEEQAGLVADLASNSEFTAEELAAMELPHLRKLHRTLVRPATDYTGRGAPRTHSAQTSEWEDYSAPTVTG